MPSSSLAVAESPEDVHEAMSPAPTMTASAGGGAGVATRGVVAGEDDGAAVDATLAARGAPPTGADAGSSSVTVATAASDIQWLCSVLTSVRHDQSQPWTSP